MLYYERGVFHVHHKIPFSACRGFRRADFFYAKKIKKTFDFPYYGIIIISVKRKREQRT